MSDENTRHAATIALRSAIEEPGQTLAAADAVDAFTAHVLEAVAALDRGRAAVDSSNALDEARAEGRAAAYATVFDAIDRMRRELTTNHRCAPVSRAQSIDALIELARRLRALRDAGTSDGAAGTERPASAVPALRWLRWHAGYERFEANDADGDTFRVQALGRPAQLIVRTGPVDGIALTRDMARELAAVLAHGLSVLHRCDNPPCTNPRHLFLGTNADNGADRASKGRSVSPPGSANGRSRLTESAVAEILRLSALGLGCRRLAARFGVNRSTIRAVCLRRTWRHVGQPAQRRVA
jgi:HPt (histidine-containing phosphotransfer) domain-containing protein